ncbi:SE1561 family protein [Indiicoccus explosivorum]|uniref:SE1561 family protein n=1 Tax=Indiicoccus explosivorum TaxID=1917864 RepID=UPI000B443D8C|nr:SE1561 family protein [Indiicoccus explosivorum]
MGKSITGQEQQVQYMKQRLNMFLNVLDSIEPEETDLEDIDRLIRLVDDMDMKLQEFKGRKSPEDGETD